MTGLVLSKGTTQGDHPFGPLMKAFDAATGMHERFDFALGAAVIANQAVEEDTAAGLGCGGLCIGVRDLLYRDGFESIDLNPTGALDRDEFDGPQFGGSAAVTAIAEMSPDGKFHFMIAGPVSPAIGPLGEPIQPTHKGCLVSKIGSLRAAK